MTVVLLAAVTAVCVAYILLAMHGEIPESISATYYTLGKHGWLFQTVMCAVAVLLFIVWFPLSEEEHLWMVFLSCASLVFVGVAPSFRMELEGKVHYASAIVCCVCAVWWQIAEGLWDVTLLFAWVGGMLSLVWRDKWCWWMECAVVGGLLANLWRVI